MTKRQDSVAGCCCSCDLSQFGGGILVGGAGVLELQGDTSNFTGSIDDLSTVIFDQSSNGTFGGAISGNGGVVQAGSGMLMLTGANSYSGETTVQSSTLVLSGDATNNPFGAPLSMMGCWSSHPATGAHPQGRLGPQRALS